MTVKNETRTGIFAIKIQSGKVLHEDFQQQVREAIRMVIAGEALKKAATGKEMDVSQVLNGALMIIANETSNLVKQTIAEAKRDGSEKLHCEFMEKMGFAND